MSSFFVSHSRKDIALRDLFVNVLSQLEQSAKAMEFSDIDIISYQEAVFISNEIRACDYVALLVGPGIVSNNYTISWIGFEVGVACANRKDLIIVTLRNSGLFFPVPYFTCCIFLPSLEPTRSELREFQNVLRRISMGETKYMSERLTCERCRNTFACFGESPVRCPGCNEPLIM